MDANVEEAIKKANKPPMSEVLQVTQTRVQSIILIILSVIVAVTQIVIIVLDPDNYFQKRYIDNAAERFFGIWTGMIVFITGIIGCCAVVCKNKAIVIVYLFFICSSLVFTIFIIGLMASLLDNRNTVYCHPICVSNYSALIALICVMLVTSLFLFAILLWGIITTSVAIYKTCDCCQQPTKIVVYGNPPPQ